MGNLAILFAFLAAALTVTDLFLFKRLAFLDKKKWKKVRAVVVLGLLVLCALFQKLSQDSAETEIQKDREARANAEKGRADAENALADMLGKVNEGVNALRVSDAARETEKAARIKAETERDEAQARLAHRDARLDVLWSPLDGQTLDVARLSATVQVTDEVTTDRKEYLLAVANPSEYPLSEVRLRFEFPYPVDSRDIRTVVGADRLTFDPIGDRVSVVPIGKGASATIRPACVGAYSLAVPKLEPHGRAEVFVRLYSGRDPRGKTLPKGREVLYSVPEWGPMQTYVFGSYRYPVGGSFATREFYAPLELRDDKTVVIGRSGPAPPKLSQSFGFANCDRP